MEAEQERPESTGRSWISIGPHENFSKNQTRHRSKLPHQAEHLRPDRRKAGRRSTYDLDRHRSWLHLRRPARI